MIQMSSYPQMVKPNGILFIDPLAASKVFASDLPITLIPLDATNQVPVNNSLY